MIRAAPEEEAREAAAQVEAVPVAGAPVRVFADVERADALRSASERTLVGGVQPVEDWVVREGDGAGGGDELGVRRR